MPNDPCAMAHAPCAMAPDPRAIARDPCAIARDPRATAIDLFFTCFLPAFRQPFTGSPDSAYFANWVRATFGLVITEGPAIQPP